MILSLPSLSFPSRSFFCVHKKKEKKQTQQANMVNTISLLNLSPIGLKGKATLLTINTLLYEGIKCPCFILGTRKEPDLVWFEYQGTRYERIVPEPWIDPLPLSFKLCNIPFGICNMGGVYAISSNLNGWYIFRGEDPFYYVTLNESYTYITTIRIPGVPPVSCMIPVYEHGEDLYRVYRENRNALFYPSKTVFYDNSGKRILNTQDRWYVTNNKGIPYIRTRTSTFTRDQVCLINNVMCCSSGFCEFAKKSIVTKVGNKKRRLLPEAPIHDTFCPRLSDAVEREKDLGSFSSSLEFCETCNRITGAWTRDFKYLKNHTPCDCKL
jgi:hypothetical protein